MHTENFLIDESAYRKAVEYVTECLPQLDRITPFALVIKSIYAIDSRRLMIAPQYKKVIRILYLIAKEETNDLEGLFAPINIVSQEKVVRLWRKSPVFKEAEEVRVLAVNIAAYFEGCFKLK